MPRYRIHRIKESPRESFRWAAHTGGLSTVKSKDYEVADEIQADTPYQAWNLMREHSRALHPGDLLEIHNAEADQPHAPGGMWITKYVGFEPAQWWVPELRKPLATGTKERDISEREACPS